MRLKGKVHKYGANVDTDVIIPARYLNVSDAGELASHCLEDKKAAGELLAQIKTDQDALRRFVNALNSVL